MDLCLNCTQRQKKQQQQHISLLPVHVGVKLSPTKVNYVFAQNIVIFLFEHVSNIG